MNYDESRDRLIEALESGGPGTLVDPYNNKVGPMLFACERYTCTESRERGGYAQFDMQFVEADTLSSGFPGLDTATQVEQAANNSTDAAAAQLDAQQANTSNLPAWWLTTVGR
jgi:prophage DNA circulation protein